MAFNGACTSAIISALRTWTLGRSLQPQAFGSLPNEWSLLVWSQPFTCNRHIQWNLTNKQILLCRDAYIHILYTTICKQNVSINAWLWLGPGSNTEQINSTEGPFKSYHCFCKYKKRSLITTNRTNLSNFLNPVIFFSDRINICQNSSLSTQCDEILNVWRRW